MADYRGYVTAAGQQFEALAKQMHYPVKIGFIEIGDGTLPDNESPISRTSLVHKTKQFPAIVEQDPDRPGEWIAKCHIPADDAINGQGYFIREMGCKLVDQGDGVLYAYRRISNDWKPLITEGEAKSFIYILRFIPSNGELIKPTINPSVVYVDKQEQERRFLEHAKEEDPHTQYALKASAPEKLDNLKKIADALNNDPNFHQTVERKIGESAGKLINVKLFSASGVYRPSPGTKTIIVELIGGGGGGGGASTTPPGQVSIGGGGAAASYIKFKINKITDDLSVNVTIGSGGAPGGGSINQRGGNGGNSLFGEYATAPGGPGGICFTGTPPVFAQNSVNNELIPALSPLALAIYAATGGPGFGGFIVSATGLAMSGNGGYSHFGHGGNNVGTNTPGLDAKSYGAGGSGSCNNGLNASLPTLGGRGAGGFCIVWEYS